MKQTPVTVKRLKWTQCESYRDMQIEEPAVERALELSGYSCHDLTTAKREGKKKKKIQHRDYKVERALRVTILGL